MGFWQFATGGGSGGSGDVVGPASSVDDQIAVFDGITGKAISASAATLTAAGTLSLPEAPYLTNVISPASVATQQDNWAPTGGTTASVWRISSSASVLITGLSGGVSGRVLTLINVGSNYFYIYPNHGSSSAANQFDLDVGGYSTTAVLPPDAALTLWYDGTSSRWRSFSDVQGTVVLSSAAGNFVRLSGTNTAGRAIMDTVGGGAGGLIVNDLYLGNSTSVDTGLARSAAGVVKVTNGSTGIGNLLSGVLVEANTAGVGTPNAIAATESGTVFTNEGVTAKNYEALPTAVAGYQFTFIVQDADGMRIVANTDDTIRVIDKVTAAAGYIESTTIGSTVTLVSVNAVEWYAIAIKGTWTDGTFTYDDTSLTTP